MQEDVLLLHGLSKSTVIMEKMEKFLIGRGYYCHNIGYESQKLGILECAQSVASQIKQSRVGREEHPLHVVAHSLGGLVAWVLILTLCPEINWGRVVQMGTPMQGSFLVRKLSKFGLYRRVFGKAGIELGEYGKALKPMNKECGVIAGTRPDYASPSIFWLGFKGHDARLFIDETKFEGMTDFLQFPAIHTNLPETPGVILQTVAFLKAGKFCKTEEG